MATCFTTAGIDRVQTGPPLLLLLAAMICSSTIASAQGDANDENSQTPIRFRVHCEHDMSAIGDVTVSVRLEKAGSLKPAVDRLGFGEFLLNANDRGSIRVEHPSLLVTPAWQQVFGSHANDEVYAFHVRRAGIIHGKVTDTSNGSAAAEVRVQVVDPQHQQVIAFATTDKKGEYAIKCPEIDCEVMLGANSDWKCDQRWRVSVVADAQTEAQLLEVTPQDPLRGRVWSVDGVPAAGVVVAHHWKGEFGFTDADGQFELPKDVITSASTTAIMAHDMTKGEVGVATMTKATTGKDLEIHLLPACSASGIVIDRNNQPISGSLVQLKMEFRVRRSIGSYVHGIAVTDKRGTYSFAGLAPGFNYRVTASSSRKVRGNQFTSQDGNTKIEALQFDNRDRIEDKHAALEQELIDSGDSPPDLACVAWHNSEPLSLRDLKGKVVLLHFWRARFGSNQRDFPLLKWLHQNHAKDGLVVIGIHSGNDYDSETLKEAIRRDELPYPIAVDQATRNTFKAYRVTIYPTIMMVGRDGKFHGRMRRQHLLGELLHELTSK